MVASCAWVCASAGRRGNHRLPCRRLRAGTSAPQGWARRPRPGPAARRRRRRTRPRAPAPACTRAHPPTSRGHRLARPSVPCHRSPAAPRARGPRHTALPPPTLSFLLLPPPCFPPAPLQSLCLLCSSAAVRSPASQRLID